MLVAADLNGVLDVLLPHWIEFIAFELFISAYYKAGVCVGPVKYQNLNCAGNKKLKD